MPRGRKRDRDGSEEGRRKRFDDGLRLRKCRRYLSSEGEVEAASAAGREEDGDDDARKHFRELVESGRTWAEIVDAYVLTASEQDSEEACLQIMERLVSYRDVLDCYIYYRAAVFDESSKQDGFPGIFDTQYYAVVRLSDGSKSREGDELFEYYVLQIYDGAQTGKALDPSAHCCTITVKSPGSRVLTSDVDTTIEVTGAENLDPTHFPEALKCITIRFPDYNGRIRNLMIRYFNEINMQMFKVTSGMSRDSNVYASGFLEDYDKFDKYPDSLQKEEYSQVLSSLSDPHDFYKEFRGLKHQQELAAGLFLIRQALRSEEWESFQQETISQFSALIEDEDKSKAVEDFAKVCELADDLYKFFTEQLEIEKENLHATHQASSPLHNPLVFEQDLTMYAMNELYVEFLNKVVEIREQIAVKNAAIERLATEIRDGFTVLEDNKKTLEQLRSLQDPTAENRSSMDSCELTKCRLQKSIEDKRRLLQGELRELAMFKNRKQAAQIQANCFANEAYINRAAVYHVVKGMQLGEVDKRKGLSRQTIMGSALQQVGFRLLHPRCQRKIVVSEEQLTHEGRIAYQNAKYGQRLAALVFGDSDKTYRANDIEQWFSLRGKMRFLPGLHSDRYLVQVLNSKECHFLNTEIQLVQVKKNKQYLEREKAKAALDLLVERAKCITGQNEVAASNLLDVFSTAEEESLLLGLAAKIIGIGYATRLDQKLQLWGDASAVRCDVFSTSFFKKADTRAFSGYLPRDGEGVSSDGIELHEDDDCSKGELVLSQPTKSGGRIELRNLALEQLQELVTNINKSENPCGKKEYHRECRQLKINGEKKLATEMIWQRLQEVQGDCSGVVAISGPVGAGKWELAVDFFTAYKDNIMTERPCIVRVFEPDVDCSLRTGYRTFLSAFLRSKKEKFLPPCSDHDLLSSMKKFFTMLPESIGFVFFVRNAALYGNSKEYLDILITAANATKNRYVVITTYNPHFFCGAKEPHMLAIRGFCDEESYHFLEPIARGDAKELIDELSGLPLGLTFAKLVITNLHISVRTYLQGLCNSTSLANIAAKENTSSFRMDDYVLPKQLAVCKSVVSMGKKQYREISFFEPLLEYCMFLKADITIPKELLLRAITAFFKGGIDEDFQLSIAVSALESLSLLINGLPAGITTSRVVQRTMINSVRSKKTERTCLLNIINVIREAYPWPPRSHEGWELCAQLIPHMESVLDYVDGYKKEHKEIIDDEFELHRIYLAHCLGNSYNIVRNYPKQLELLLGIEGQLDRIPLARVGYILTNLALAYEGVRNFAKQEEIANLALQRKKADSSYSPITIARTCAILARACLEQRKYTETRGSLVEADQYCAKVSTSTTELEYIRIEVDIVWGRMYLAIGDLAQADEKLRSARDTLLRRDANPTPILTITYRYLGEVCFRKGTPAGDCEAEELLSSNLDFQKSSYCIMMPSLETAVERTLFCQVLKRRGNIEYACTVAEDAFNMFKSLNYNGQEVEIVLKIIEECKAHVESASVVAQESIHMIP